MTFTAEQVERLLRPIKALRVLQAQGQSHIPAYDVVAHLNRMFGFGGWDKEIRSIDLVEERNDVPGKNGWYVTYRCHMRLIIRDPEGNVVTTKEDGACGSANNLPSLGDAHDFAYKNAISYALKRCAKDLGDQFGLSLYNKGSTGALVGTTLVGSGQVGTGVDLEDHAPTPLSLGNDERQVDHETGEITEAPAEPITKHTMGEMQALFAELGITGQREKRDYCGLVLNRIVESAGKLTEPEGRDVVKAQRAQLKARKVSA